MMPSVERSVSEALPEARLASAIAAVATRSPESTAIVVNAGHSAERRVTYGDLAAAVEAFEAAIDAVRPTRRSQGDSGASEAPASPPAAELQLAPASPSVAAPALAPSAAVRAAPLPEPTPTLAIASDRLGFVQVDVSGSADRLEVSLSATSAAAPILAGEAPRLAQDLAAAGVALASYVVNGQRADLAADTANPLAGNAGSSAGSNGTAAGHSQQQPQAQASPAPAPEPGRRDSGVLRPTAARQTPSPDRFA